MKLKANKENLIKALQQIGWSVRDHGCDHLFIYNHKGKNTHWYIFHDRVQLDDFIGSFDETPSCCFYFKSCRLEWLTDLPGKEDEIKTTIALTAKYSNSVFLFFANYELKDKKTA